MSAAARDLGENADPVIWRGMTRAELDRAYNNSAAVAESAAMLAEWTRRSAVFRAEHPQLLDRAYGPKPRNLIDIFRCGAAGAPLLVFLHGGYWQRNAKDMFACMAVGPLARGFDVALVGYTLAPEASLTQIVAEVGEAVRWLRKEGPSLRVGEHQLIVSGWSAGGHLAASLMNRLDVDAGLAISGVFDLEPCRLNYLNEALRLSPEEAVSASPIRHLPGRAGKLIVTYGGLELPELRRQSADFEGAWSQAGLQSSLLPLDEHNHFTILDELIRPNGRLTDAAVSLIA